MELIFVFIALPAVVTLIDFFGFLFAGRRVVHKIILHIVEVIALIILPLMYVNLEDKNDCCGDSAVFSPKHLLTVQTIALLCLLAYFYSSYRSKIISPVVEVMVNCLLFIGIILNVFIAVHTKDFWLAIGGNMPVILLAILALVKNQEAFIQYAGDVHNEPASRFERWAWKLLRLEPVLQYPVIFILCIPVLVVITGLLLFAGQRPDSFIRAFTDTYKHGFSQWDYKCDNVQCGGHYLCSVAANGHKTIVKPQRLGMRNGRAIICNRQLLISNAFEDLLQEKLPVVHKGIRKQYNKVGDMVHRHYHIFNNKYVCDLVYILMKPLEWFFLLALYTFEKRPENRIASQYLSRFHRQQIDNGPQQL